MSKEPFHGEIVLKVIICAIIYAFGWKFTVTQWPEQMPQNVKVSSGGNGWRLISESPPFLLWLAYVMFMHGENGESFADKQAV